MISRRCKYNALCRELPFLMSMLLVLSGCNLTIARSTPPTPVHTQSPAGANLLEAVKDGGLICNSPASGEFFSEKSLVLATDRLTYDQAEVNQLSAFIDSQGNDLSRSESNVPSTPPDTLSYITGSAPSSVLYGSSYPTSSCDVQFELANISQETLQIPQINLRYLRSAEPNAQLYRLINVCSIGKRLQEGDTCPIRGAGPQEGYGVDFPIGRKPVNTVYTDKPRRSLAMDPTLPEIPTLRPGDAAKIDMEIHVKSDTSGLFVSAIPEAIVTSLGKTQTVALTQLTMDIAIAAPQNVSCYALEGNTFMEQNPQIQEGSWCV